MVDYCISLLQKKRKEETIINYFAECLRLVSVNTAALSPNGRFISVPLYDVLDDINNPNKKEPTAEEIIERMKAKMNS